MKKYVYLFSILIILSAFGIYGCSSGGGGGGGGAVSSKVGLTGVTGTVSVEDGNNGAEADADVFVLGQEGGGTVTDDSGDYALDVSTTLSGLVASKASREVSATDVSDDYYLIVYSNDKNYGTVVPFTIAEGEWLTINPVINGVGSISGTFTLQGETDHMGITVYLPGTAYSATTTSDGSFYMAGIPSGWYPYLRAEKDGYHYIVISGVMVLKDSNTPIAPNELLISTGAIGTVTIDGGVEFTNSLDATLTFGASDDAVLMMVSESSTFLNAQWLMYNTPMPWVFSPGDGTREIYAKFADANGLESGTYLDTIYIDTDPMVASVYPVNLSSINESAPLIEWRYDPPMPSPEYMVEVSADPAFGTSEASSWQAETTYQVQNPLSDQGAYYWRVKMRDGDGNEYNWAGPWEFGVDLGTVVLTSPMGTISDTMPTLRWTTSEVAGAIYHVQVARDSAFTDMVAETGAAATASYDVPTPLDNDTLYYWRVAVVDPNGITGQWSAVETFHVYLGVVSFISPMGYITDSSPTLDWTSSALPNPTYTVEVDDDPNFGSVLEAQAGLTETSYAMVSVLENNKMYYWRVAVVDEYGQQGTWAGPQSFTLTLGSVALLSPQGVITNTTPQLDWVDSYVPGATYRMQLATDSAFTAISNDQSGIPGSYFDLTNALGNLVNYFWRVAVVDGNAVQGDWSASGMFAIDLGTVTPLSPTGTIADTAPTLTWTASALDVTYEVQLATDDTFTTFVAGMMNTSSGSTASITTPVLDNNTTYFWRVRVKDANGVYGRWSYSQVFKVDIASVNLISPDGSIPDTKPEFSWTASAVANDYHIMVSTDSSFGTWAVNTTTGGATTYTNGVTFALNTIYYWRVAVIDINGTQGNWSQVKSFTVQFDSLQLIYPSGTIADSKPTIEWTPSTIAGMTYEMEVSNNLSFAVANIVDGTGGTPQSANTFAMTTRLSNLGTYYWRVRMVDANNVPGSWQGPVPFTLNLGSVTLLSPTGTISTVKPTLTWSDSPLIGESYRVVVDDDYLFGSPLLDTTVASASYTFPSTQLSHLGTYYWRVAIVDSNGEMGIWSESYMFSVDLGTIYLNTPASNIYTNDQTPTFEWDDNPNVNYFKLQISTSPDMTTFVFDQYFANYHDTVMSYTLPSALASTDRQDYYWRVLPLYWDGVYSWGTASEIRHFVLDTTPPAPDNMYINDNENLAISTDAKVFMTATDVGGMDAWYVSTLSTQPSATSSLWNGILATSSFSANMPVTLTSGTGSKTLYAYFRDLAGNVSSTALSDSINLMDFSFDVAVSGGRPGYPKLVVDSSDNLHMLYCEYGPSGSDESYLYYTEKYAGSSTWTTPVNLATFPDYTMTFPFIMTFKGCVMDNFDISVDSSNYPHVIFDDQYNTNDLMYKYRYYGLKLIGGMYYLGTWWSTDIVVDTASSLYPSIVVDSTDAANVSYYRGGDLVYSKNSSSNHSDWTTNKVVVDNPASASVGYYTDIIVDSSDRPHISYQDYTNSQLKYAYVDSSSLWQIEVVDNSGKTGYYTSVSLLSTSYMNFAYMDYSNYNLMFATNYGGELVTYNVDADGNVGYYPEVVTDKTSTYRSFIAYYDSTNSDLKFATNKYRTAVGDWDYVTLDSYGSVGYYPDMAVDSNGYVHIIYYDATAGTLNYATTEP